MRRSRYPIDLFRNKVFRPLRSPVGQHQRLLNLSFKRLQGQQVPGGRELVPLR